MAFQSSLGIDIGDNAVRLVYLKAGLRGARMVAHGAFSLGRDLTPKDAMAAAAEAMKGFIARNRIASGNVFLGIPRGMAIVRDLELPLAVRENLREAVGYELEKYVPFSADEVHFDYQVLQEDRDAGRLKLLLVLVRKESMAPFVDLGGTLDAGLAGIEVSSTAVANYVLADQRGRKGEPFLVLYRADDSLEVDLLRERRLVYSRSLALPGDTDALREMFGGEAVPLRAALGNGDGPLRALTCGPREEDGMLRIVQEEWNLDLIQADLSATGLPSPSLIPAYGLALKGLGAVPVTINLLPPEHRRKTSRAGFYVMVALACLLVVSTLAWGGGSAARERLYLKDLNRELQRLEPEVAAVHEIERRNAEVEKEIDFLNRIRGVRSPLLPILLDLSENIPENAWISSLSYAGGKVDLEGFADSASGLIPLLEASPHFKDAVFRSAITKDKDGKERFRVGLTVD